MKHKMLLIVLFILVMFTDCKKDRSDPPIVGLWVGKYGSLTTYPSNGFAMLFRNNGTVRVFDGADTTSLDDTYKATGTYSVSGTTITTTYEYAPGNVFSTTVEVDAKFTFQEGTWGPEGSPGTGGRFFLNKK